MKTNVNIRQTHLKILRLAWTRITTLRAYSCVMLRCHKIVFTGDLRFLGAFAQGRKPVFSFVMSVRLSACISEATLDGYSGNLVFEVCIKIR